MKKYLLSTGLIICFFIGFSQEAFIGMWTIDVKGGGVSWLNVHERDGFLDAELLWIGGSVLPVSHVYMADENTLVVTRTSDRKPNKESERTHTWTWSMRVTNSDEGISGSYSGPNWSGEGEFTSSFTGKKLADIPERPDLAKVKFGKKIDLFNGKDLTGWEIIGDRPNGFSAKDGILVNNPIQPKDGDHVYYGNLRTTETFDDFNLSLEVNVPEGNNSGVYLRGMYEIQVFDSYGKDVDSHNMGALYSRITPKVAAEKPGGEWQSLDITLYNRHVTVILNGEKIIDNQPVYGPTGGAIQSDVNAPGPIYLQGDHGNVSYRNLVLKPIKG